MAQGRKLGRGRQLRAKHGAAGSRTNKIDEGLPKAKRLPKELRKLSGTERGVDWETHQEHDPLCRTTAHTLRFHSACCACHVRAGASHLPWTRGGVVCRFLAWVRHTGRHGRPLSFPPSLPPVIDPPVRLSLLSLPRPLRSSSLLHSLLFPSFLPSFLPSHHLHAHTCTHAHTHARTHRDTHVCVCPPPLPPSLPLFSSFLTSPGFGVVVKLLV